MSETETNLTTSIQYQGEDIPLVPLVGEGSDEAERLRQAYVRWVFRQGFPVLDTVWASIDEIIGALRITLANPEPKFWVSWYLEFPNNGNIDHRQLYGEELAAFVRNQEDVKRATQRADHEAWYAMLSARERFLVRREEWGGESREALVEIANQYGGGVKEAVIGRILQAKCAAAELLTEDDDVETFCVVTAADVAEGFRQYADLYPDILERERRIA